MTCRRTHLKHRPDGRMRRCRPPQPAHIRQASTLRGFGDRRLACDRDLLFLRWVLRRMDPDGFGCCRSASNPRGLEHGGRHLEESWHPRRCKCRTRAKPRPSAASQLVHFLCRYPPFSFLPEDELRALTPHISRVAFPADTVVFTQGESQVDGLYVIQSGAAERYFEQNRSKTLHSILAARARCSAASPCWSTTCWRSARCGPSRIRRFTSCPTRRSSTCADGIEAFSEYFTDTFGKRMLDRTYAAVIAKSAPTRADALSLFNQPVKRGLQPRPAGLQRRRAPSRRRPGLMSRRRCSSIFVRGGDGDIVGILTDNDLRQQGDRRGPRPSNNRWPRSCPHPSMTIAGHAPVFEALMAMMQQGIKHIGVTDDAAAGRRCRDQPGRAGRAGPVAAVPDPGYRRGREGRETRADPLRACPAWYRR
ncbi:MAG: hypothetical protein MZV70_64485 [Desulfobacterales bacterium]|nr:hypothetical protein [Desulfobacterales bacterium]